MRSRGDRPEDGPDERQEPPAKSRRRGRGRGRPDDAGQEQVSSEELGWLADLRTAKEQRADIGPGDVPPVEPVTDPRWAALASPPPAPSSPAAAAPSPVVEPASVVGAAPTVPGADSHSGKSAHPGPDAGRHADPSGAGTEQIAPSRRAGGSGDQRARHAAPVEPPAAHRAEPTAPPAGRAEPPGPKPVQAVPVEPRPAHAAPVEPRPAHAAPTEARTGRHADPSVDSAPQVSPAAAQPPVTDTSVPPVAPVPRPTGPVRRGRFVSLRDTLTGMNPVVGPRRSGQATPTVPPPVVPSPPAGRHEQSPGVPGGADTTEIRSRRPRPASEPATDGTPVVPGRPGFAPVPGAQHPQSASPRPGAASEPVTRDLPAARASAAPVPPPALVPPPAGSGRAPVGPGTPPVATVYGSSAARDAGAAPVARAGVTQTGAVAAVRPVGPLPGAAVPSPGAARPPHGPGSAQPPRGPDRDATEPGSGRPGWLGSDAIRNARFKLRRQMRSRRQLRLGVLVMVCVLVLGILPVFFAIRTANHDPVFDTLDALAVPQWAATEVDDQVSGSSWCLVDCRLRERTARSQHGWEETAQEYERALIDQGWRPWQVSLCPGQPVEGRYSCWRRDELTLDLWVRPRTCRPDPVGVLPSEATGELPSAGPGADPGDGADAAGCTGSTVTLKVRNAIDDERIGPQPSMDPSFTGETPDPILTEDPLAPTPS